MKKKEVVSTINKMRTGAIYIRVSTDKQEELSPDAQRRLLLEYAKKNSIIITEKYIFTENGISGRKADKRPQFQKMIALAKSKEHPFDTILVWKFSRFARNQEESIVYKSLLKKNNVDVISISEPLIEGPFGSLIERIIEWMDEYYSIRLSGEVIRGMTENALRGAYQAIPPLGYDYVGSKEAPTVNAVEAESIRFIYEEFLNNKSMLSIVKTLNRKGVQSKRGNALESRTIEYILKNPFYTGKVRWNYSERGRELKDKSEWIISDGKHEPIISGDIFEKVQEKLLKNVRKTKSRDVSACRHWLSGILVCSNCGRSLSYSKQNQNKKTYSHFQCWGYSHGLCDKSHSLPEQTAIDNVVIGLEKSLLSNNINYKIISDLSQVSDFDIEFLKKSLNKLDQKVTRIKESYRNGIDTMEEYKENKEILRMERAIIEGQIQDASTSNRAQDSTIDNDRMLENINEVISVLKSNDSSYEMKGSAIRSILKEIVFDKSDFSFDFHFFLS